MPLRVVAKLAHVGSPRADAPTAPAPSPSRAAARSTRLVQRTASLWRRWMVPSHRATPSAAAAGAPAPAVDPAAPTLGEMLAVVAAACGDAATAPSPVRLQRALDACAPLGWSARAMLWDQLALPVQPADRAPALQAVLDAWLVQHARERAHGLGYEQGAPSSLRAAVARRLLSAPFAAACVDVHGPLRDIATAWDLAAQAPVAAKWTDAVTFWPMTKFSATPEASDKAPSYLGDLAADRYWRISPHVVAGGFFKVRAALDEDGNPWVMRVGRLLPKGGAQASGATAPQPARPAGRGVLQDDAMADELHAMRLADSPLRPTRLFLHASGRIYGLMPRMAADLAQVERVVADFPEAAPWFTAVLRHAVDQALGSLAALHARGYGHYDVSPENLFLDPEGFGLLGDYGLALPFARVLGARGRLGLMAPEVAFGPQDAARGAADVWSLGMTVWALLAPEEVARTPLLRANDVGELAAAYASFAAWAPMHLVPALRAPHRLPSLGEQGGASHAARWQAAASAAAARDPELALAVLPSALRSVCGQRLTAARLRAKLARQLARAGGGPQPERLRGASETTLVARAPGEPLVALLEACTDNGLARAFVALRGLPPRPTPGPRQATGRLPAASPSDPLRLSALCLALGHAARALLSQPSTELGCTLAAAPLAQADALLAAVEADRTPLHAAELQLLLRARRLRDAVCRAMAPGADRLGLGVGRALAALDESLLLSCQLG